MNDVPLSPQEGATLKVYRSFLRALELQRLVPGQRLIESDIVAYFGVGRNAVREALQRLEAQGVVELNRHRSATVRVLGLEETLEALEVAEVMIGLVVRVAASRYQANQHGVLLSVAFRDLEDAGKDGEPGSFSRACRRFYDALLSIGGNRELLRLFPAMSLHIIHLMYQSPRLQQLRLADYRDIRDAIVEKDTARAPTVGRHHIDNVRRAILEEAEATNRFGNVGL